MCVDNYGGLPHQSLFKVSSITDDPTQIDTDVSDGELI